MVFYPIDFKTGSTEENEKAAEQANKILKAESCRVVDSYAELENTVQILILQMGVLKKEIDMLRGQNE